MIGNIEDTSQLNMPYVKAMNPLQGASMLIEQQMGLFAMQMIKNCCNNISLIQDRHYKQIQPGQEHWLGL